ncbi:hypothetical protein, partial [Streptomyces millisiae]
MEYVRAGFLQGPVGKQDAVLQAGVLGQWAGRAQSVGDRVPEVGVPVRRTGGRSGSPGIDDASRVIGHRLVHRLLEPLEGLGR